MNAVSIRKLERDHPPLEAQCPQDADLLPPLHYGAEGDHAHGRDADDQTETHETFDEVQEAGRLLLAVLQLLLDRVRLHTVAEHGRFDLLRHRLGLAVIGQRDVVRGHGRRRVDRVDRRLVGVETVQGADLAVDHADDRQRDRLAGFRVDHLDRRRSERLVSRRDALQLEGVRAAQLALTGQGEDIDHRHVRLCQERLDDCRVAVVAIGALPEQ